MGLTPYIWGAASHQSLVPVYTEMQIQSSTPPIDIIMICHGSDGRYGCAADLQLTSSATSCTWLHLHPQRRPRRCRARTPDHQPIRPCPPFLRALAFAVSPASLPPPQPLLVEKAIPMLPPCPPGLCGARAAVLNPHASRHQFVGARSPRSSGSGSPALLTGVGAHAGAQLPRADARAGRGGGR